MRVLLLALLASLPFWESKPAADWSDAELEEFLTESPWAQQAVSAKETSGAQVYLASARPVREAEAERARRNKPAAEDPNADEYAEFLRANEGRVIVLAAALPNAGALANPAELKRMEEECVLRVGRKTYKMTGHFPPSPSDPWLRLVFPRAVTPADKTFRFDLYLPSVPEPYRVAMFRVKELSYRGRLEM
ncbi:MAG: hypothetical protein ACM336_01400 [Acidobacteriota bacterium]